MAEETGKKTTRVHPETQEGSALSDEQLDKASGGTLVKGWSVSRKADAGAVVRDVEPTGLESPNITFHIPKSD